MVFRLMADIMILDLEHVLLNWVAHYDLYAFVHTINLSNGNCQFDLAWLDSQATHFLNFEFTKMKKTFYNDDNDIE